MTDENPWLALGLARQSAPSRPKAFVNILMENRDSEAGLSRCTFTEASPECGYDLFAVKAASAGTKQRGGNCPNLRVFQSERPDQSPDVADGFWRRVIACYRGREGDELSNVLGTLERHEFNSAEFHPDTGMGNSVVHQTACYKPRYRACR
jgi:hypothetical protein